MDQACYHGGYSKTYDTSPMMILVYFGIFCQISRQNFAAQFPSINRNITMQNTVIESNALALSANVYFNSTTKFVKGLAGPPSANPVFSALLPDQQHPPQSSLHLSSLILKSSPPRTHPAQGRSPNGKEGSLKSGLKEEMSEVQVAAISLSGNIYMNSTTKYVKGHHSPSPSQPQKKSRSQGKQKQSSPKKIIDPQAIPSSVKKQRTSQKTAMEMAGSNYMTSTTKYMKTNPEGSSLLDLKAKAEKIVRSNAAVRTNQKLERVLSRDKPRRERESIGPKAQFSPTKSQSSSGSKIQRKKNRTKELKFIERNQVEESVVTVKERPSSIDFKTRRNDTKIQIQQEKPLNKPETLQIAQQHQYKIAQINQNRIPVVSNNPQPKLQLPRIQRNAINQAKSADAKKTEAKQESTRPFSRHPQHTRPQLLSRQNNELIKSATSLPASDLPLQTPIKPKFQSSKVIPASASSDHQNVNTKPIAKSQQLVQICAIKEQRSSAIQNTKTTITNKKSTHYLHHQEESSSAHVDNINKNSEVSKLIKNQGNRIIRKDAPVDVIHQGYAVNNNHSPRNIKIQERKQDTSASVVANTIRPLPKRPQQSQPIKESHVESRKTTTPSILEEKTPSPKVQKPIEQKPIKTQPSERGSKTSIQQSTIDLSKKKIAPIAPIVQNQGSRVLQSMSPPARLQQSTSNVKKPEPIIQKQPSLRQNVKETEVKLQIIKKSSNEQIVRHESSLKRSYALFQATHRLYNRNISKAFEMIANQAKSLKIHSKQASILAYQTINFLRNVQKSLKSSIFEQIKRVLPSKLIIKKQTNTNANKEMAADIIFRTLASKYRQSFELLKINASFHLPETLLGASKKTQESDKHVNKSYILQQFRSILQSLSRRLIQKCFNKILLESISHQKHPISKEAPPQQIRSPPKYTKPSRNYQAQKTSLFQSKTQLQSSISALQSRMSDKKRYLDNQKSKLSKKQSQLIKKNKATETTVLQKRTNNKEMKKKLDSLGQQQDLDISLPQYEPLIGILTEIYSTIFASKQQKVNAEALIQRYELNKQDHNPLLDEWSALLLNARLKQEVSQWQGSNPFSSCEGRLRGEGEGLVKMARSFIRERYLWEWVKVTAETA